MNYSGAVLQRLQAMTLAEKVGQLFIFTWKNEAQANNDLRFHPGGYIRIYSDAHSVARQTLEIQQQTRTPLIIAADLERGIGGTIGGALETVTFMALGATRDERAAYDAAHMIGKEAAALGINMNYAPLLDVNSNPANPVINTRSFGSDPNLVAKLGIAFTRGLRDAGVAACGKHFPGHGNTSVDSHSMLGTITGPRAELDAIELLPFRALIKAGVDAMMSAHLLVPALEPEALPATLSRGIMTTLLRDELGFTGVAVSDALDMGAVAKNFAPEIAIPMAINAGCDQLIMPQDNVVAVDVLTRAVTRGDVTEDRLNEAVARILTLKEIRGIFEAPLPDPAKVHSRIFVPANVSRALEIARQSITIVKNEDNLPLQRHQNICCVTFGNGDDGRGGFMEPRSFSDYLSLDGWDVNTVEIIGGDAPETTRLSATIAEADIVILAAYVNVRLNSGTIELPAEIIEYLRPILNRQKPYVLVSFGSPYILKHFPEATSYLCAYGATQPSQQAMAEVLKGAAVAGGVLPVTLQ